MGKALVVTPTTGAPELTRAVKSVLNQTIPVDHLVVVDGQQFSDKVDSALWGIYFSDSTLYKTVLPFNTGGGGFYGHRIMAAFAHLVNHDYILFLDQDNWFDEKHVETMINLIETNSFDWCHSLRKIYNKDGEYLCDDNCESLGRWNAWVGNNVFLVDSSSYCFKTNFFRQIGHIWDHGWGADRRFYNIVKDHLKHDNYGCTTKHTLCYSLGGNEGSVTGQFFEEGNLQMRQRFINKLPWLENIK